MLKIRLARTGSKKDPHYAIVVIESTKSRNGQFVEKVGHYHPRVRDLSSRLVVNTDAIKKWVGVGAQPTDVVQRLVKSLNVGLFEAYQPHKSPSTLQGVSKKQKKEMDKKAAAEALEAKKARESAKKAAAEAPAS